MSSSISSSDWRRFFRLAVGTAVAVVAIVYAFVVLVDPFDTLPLSPSADRGPIADNQRFSYPALARSDKFDSAVFGTSTSRLLRPAALNAEFAARFANLAMNSATPYEQSRLMAVFRAAHPAARVVIVGVDQGYCLTGGTDEKFTPRPFPEWMYGHSPWLGYREMFNLYAVQSAGQQFGVLIGIKQPTYGHDGYANFLPSDSQYDPARVAEHLSWEGTLSPTGQHDGDPATWDYAAIDRLHRELAVFAPTTRRILYFVPYNHRLMPPADSIGMVTWRECKRRVGALAGQLPNTLAVDFMLPTSITTSDDNYWDGQHYRLAIADRIVRDLAAADRGETSPDYQVLGSSGVASARR